MHIQGYCRLAIACLQLGTCIATQVPLLKSEEVHISANASELLSLHKNLIDFQSITANEKAIGLWLKSYLEAKNFTVELQEVTEKRYNVFAYPGARKTKVLVTSHIDTVGNPFNSTDSSACMTGSNVWVQVVLKYS